jgi:predicted 3-demethylubiquinone-9 3-methyltransferase (glyoxalase superfamily)
MNVEFELMGVQFSVLNGGPFFKIDPSISFFVSSSDKSEITELWEKLSD